MNYTNESIQEITEMIQVLKDRGEGTLERWLDTAFHLDYITHKEKDTTVSLLKKWRESKLTQTDLFFCKANYHDLKRMKEILKNTRLPMVSMQV